MLRSGRPWRDLRSIEAALRWAHFSSQRSTARPGYDEDGDAILKAFAAPAGLEESKGLDRRLWGAETRTALKNLHREAGERLKKHEIALAYVSHMLTAPSASEAAENARRMAELFASLGSEFDGVTTGMAQISKRLRMSCAPGGTHLMTVPVDIIKIDKSFVDQLAQSAASRAIVEGFPYRQNARYPRRRRDRDGEQGRPAFRSRLR